MILILLWAIAGVILGYESAKHGIMQIAVPALYLLAMFLWVIVGVALVNYVAGRKPRRAPSPEEVRKAWETMSKGQRELERGKAGQP